MKKKIIFRCDSSNDIGTGHVMRCLSLAREITSRGGEVIFLSREHKDNLIEYVRKEFNVISLSQNNKFKISQDNYYSNPKNRYEELLGCSQEKDAEICIEQLALFKIYRFDWLVLDHYSLDHKWYEAFLRISKAHSHLFKNIKDIKLLVIDDLANREFKANILLNQNFYIEDINSIYKELLPANCVKLLGPSYALLSKEYSKLHKTKYLRKELNRVLIYFGGNDIYDLTLISLQALMSPEFSNIEVDIVLGIQSKNIDLVREKVRLRPLTNLYTHQKSLASLILNADLAIGAGGATTWERFCLSLPSIVVTVADNQLSFNKQLSLNNYIYYLGNAEDINKQLIKKALLEYMTKPSIINCSEILVDGMGVNKVASAMLGVKFPININLATKSDEQTLFEWANDPQVIINSLTNKTFSRQEYRTYFLAGIKDVNVFQYIFKDADMCPFGQLRFERISCEDNRFNSQFSINISIDRSFRGKGLSRKILDIAIYDLKKRTGEDIALYADVINGNKTSENLFSKYGFRLKKVSENKPTKSYTRFLLYP